VLWQVTATRVFFSDNTPRRGFPTACYDIHQGRFAGSVFTDKGYPVLAVNVKRNAGK
jgi:hypothetical protein